MNIIGARPIILSYNHSTVNVEILLEMSSSDFSMIELAICLVKKNPMETILQKATELGVSKITPIVSERTEVKDGEWEGAGITNENL